MSQGTAGAPERRGARTSGLPSSARGSPPGNGATTALSGTPSTQRTRAARGPAAPPLR